MAALLSRIPGGVGVEWIVLRLDHASLAHVAHAREALGDEAADAPLACGGEQASVPSVRSRLVSLNGRSRLPRETDVRQRGRLVDDRLRLRLEHGLAHCPSVEQIECDRLCAQRTHAFGASGRPVGADHLVTFLDQLGNEAGADRSARPGGEEPSWCSPFAVGVTMRTRVTSSGARGSTGMTRREGGM